ncbi:hypothetical protein SMGD1_1485 [Sulfurimonas gotlandica GD1]|uniref:Uncharacterized protein n=1 Tax=Sulfurimonas gotlandica (strain DSM 19862 / JCM 16533 / GD1) TaxID=929558 RepID=B6BHL1_SULGG|nr:hypothetical protein [Sulfurimonas gotlandica]EDZ62905.1 hypothetical protein CBGD1_523 [Sulfurimonas gotlandica GD1]EHP30009.1 hypothetical protein SMGD1_1485 [Sulfurimonas gotlandica GD1]
MLHSDEKYKIEEKEVDGILKFHVEFDEKIRAFDTLLEAKMAIKTFKMGKEYQKHTGMELFIEKD